jgi:hypothetical protein
MLFNSASGMTTFIQNYINKFLPTFSFAKEAEKVGYFMEELESSPYINASITNKCWMAKQKQTASRHAEMSCHHHQVVSR